MTAQPLETDTLLDIAALVGEMEALPCESAGHGTVRRSHDDGPATHYGRFHCPACGAVGVKSYCATFVQWIQSATTLNCFKCRTVVPSSLLVTIIGPVNP